MIPNSAARTTVRTNRSRGGKLIAHPPRAFGARPNAERLTPLSPILPDHRPAHRPDLGVGAGDRHDRLDRLLGDEGRRAADALDRAVEFLKSRDHPVLD